MARTRLSPSRQANIKNANIGKIILFCEGETEKNYFEYFADILTKNKYNNIQVVVETASGNASRVLNAADEYLKNEVNLRKYANYKKYLVFDCDAPPNVQRVINKMLISMNNYELVVSAYFGVSGHLNRNYSDSIPETSGHPAVSSILRQQRVIFKALHDFFCCDFPH